MFLLSNTGEAESITTHYLLCLGMYRAFYLLNWIYRFVFKTSPEAIVVLAGILQTALYSDFFYIYYKRYCIHPVLTASVGSLVVEHSSCPFN